jgi:hypothetical protein
MPGSDRARISTVSRRTGHFTSKKFTLRTAVASAALACAAGCAASPAAAGPDRPAAAANAGASASPAVQTVTRSASVTVTMAAAADTTAPAQPAATTGTAVAGTTVPGAANCPLFPANNVWNTNISKLPVNKHSAAWLRSMDSASTYLHPDFGPNEGGYPYGIPFTVVTSATAKVHIKFQYASQSYRGLYPFTASTPIEGGKNAPRNTDRHAIMVNRSTCTLYELWQAHYAAGGKSTAGSGAMWKLTSNALRPAGWTSADAAGLPILPGLLDYAQVEQAVRTGKPITHAIRFTADHTAAAYLWPARHQAGSGSSATYPPMGARFRLKAGFSVSTFCHNAQAYCRAAKAVLTEMKNYGLILADNGSNWFFQGTAYPQWPDALVSLLKQIPARDFQAIDESCLQVSRNSGQARAKAGCPIG